MPGQHTFMENIRKVWESSSEGMPMVRFANKLKAVKKKLQAWNKEVYGQIGHIIKQSEDKVLELESSFDRDPFEANGIQLCKANQELNDKLQIEELF